MYADFAQVLIVAARQLSEGDRFGLELDHPRFHRARYLAVSCEYRASSSAGDNGAPSP